MKKILLMCLVMAGMPACTTVGQKHTVQTAATVSNQSQSAKPKLTRTKSVSRKKDPKQGGPYPRTKEEILDRIEQWKPGGAYTPLTENTDEYTYEVVCILVPGKTCPHCELIKNKTSRLFQINEFFMKCYTCGWMFDLRMP